MHAYFGRLLCGVISDILVRLASVYSCLNDLFYSCPPSISTPDKAGGNKFAKDFEEGSQKLQEFVSFLENQMPVGPPLLEALGNADVFYEMQYKEVKIVASVSINQSFRQSI